MHIKIVGTRILFARVLNTKKVRPMKLIWIDKRMKYIQNVQSSLEFVLFSSLCPGNSEMFCKTYWTIHQ